MHLQIHDKEASTNLFFPLNLTVGDSQRKAIVSQSKEYEIKINSGFVTICQHVYGGIKNLQFSTIRITANTPK
jgi:hypothetical protein